MQLSCFKGDFIVVTLCPEDFSIIVGGVCPVFASICTQILDSHMQREVGHRCLRSTEYILTKVAPHQQNEGGIHING
jgi:hypothetical protein